MKQTQKQRIAELLRTYGKVSIRDLSGDNLDLAWEFRARVADLRRDSWIIEHVKGEKPSDNSWVLIQEPGKPPKAKVLAVEEKDGQREMIFDLRYE